MLITRTSSRIQGEEAIYCEICYFFVSMRNMIKMKMRLQLFHYMKEHEVEGGNLRVFNVGDLASEENSEMFNLVNSFDF